MRFQESLPYWLRELLARKRVERELELATSDLDLFKLRRLMNEPTVFDWQE